jgi:branched-chain amino acid transport system substrate-binding protein
MIYLAHKSSIQELLMKMCRLLYISLISILLFSSCKKENNNDTTEINIGALLSLTGNWSSLGITSQEAIKLAAADINTYMEQVGSGYRFSSTIYDTKLDTALALESIQDAHNKNIHFIIGPQSSAELGAVISYANQNNILLVSQSSTASSLAIANDAIFRFCPGDAVEGDAVARTIFSTGRRSIISLSRDDAGNRGLQQSVGNIFTSLGGNVDALTPYTTTTTDFSALLTTLKTTLQQKINSVGADQVGIYLASFDECVELFKQADQDPIFSSVNWYGGDGVVLSNALITDLQAAAFATKTSFFAPTFGLPFVPHPDLSTIAAAIKNSTGIEPDAYALAAYDAMWVIAQTIVAAPESANDISKAKLIFNAEASRHFGITGPVQLNAAGDRSTGSFDYWGIVFENGLYQWELVGKSL